MNNSLILKSFTAIILFLTLLNTAVRAQEESIEKKVTFGVLLGTNASLIASFNSSSMQGASTGSYHNHPIISLNGGFTADVNLTNVSFLQTGLLYSGKGGKNDPFISRLHYLEIPLIIAKKFKIGNASFSAGGGGYVGFLLKDMQTTTSVVYYDQFVSDESSYVSNSYKKLDFGARLALIFNPSHRVSLALAYDLGIVDVKKNHHYFTNQSLSLSFGYKFR